MSFIVPHRPLPSTSSLLAVVGRVLPASVVEAVVATHAVPHARRRKLPGEIVLLLVIAWQLVPPAALDLVLTTLLLGRRLHEPVGEAAVPATESGISRARYRWGARPMVALFHDVCRPLATPQTVGAFFHGLRLVAVDGTFEDLADTPANVHAFGRHKSQHGPSAFPQLLGVHLVECGTHAIFESGFWPCHTAAAVAAKRLMRSVTPGMLVLYDQGLHGFGLVTSIRQRGAEFLGRVPPIQTFTLVKRLPDGTMLGRFWAKPPCTRTRCTPALLVRVITYTLTDPARPGYHERHRLMTSLLDAAQYPALELICAYHERWEIEVTIDEMKTHQRLSAQPLRSKKPVGVIQEAYGLLLAHYLVRAVMHDAAQQAGMDPDRLSFVHAVRLIDQVLPCFQLVDSAGQDALYQLLLADIRRFHLPARRLRIAPRARKRPWSKHRYRARTADYRILRVAPFATVVAVLPPDPASLVPPPKP